MVRKYKSGSNAGHHVQMEKGTELLQSFLATAPTDGNGRGQDAPRCFGEGSLLDPGRMGDCCH